MFSLESVINKLKYWLLALFLVPFFVWFTNAANDLMRQIMQPAIDNSSTIDLWESVDAVWQNVFEHWHEIDILDGTSQKVPSLIVKATRFLLSLVVALSVTMILYNGMTYIIQTWQWKEWKSLVKNVVYIVIWIIISLFSITIITLLQSISTSLDKETKVDWNRDDDDKIVYTEDSKWLNLKNLLNLK